MSVTTLKHFVKHLNCSHYTVSLWRLFFLFIVVVCYSKGLTRQMYFLKYNPVLFILLQLSFRWIKFCVYCNIHLGRLTKSCSHHPSLLLFSLFLLSATEMYLSTLLTHTRVYTHAHMYTHTLDNSNHWKQWLPYIYYWFTTHQHKLTPIFIKDNSQKYLLVSTSMF